MSDKKNDEGFLERWSRRKAEVSEESAATAENPLPVEDTVKGQDTPLPNQLASPLDTNVLLCKRGKGRLEGVASEPLHLDLEASNPDLILTEEGSTSEVEAPAEDLTDADMPALDTLTEDSDYTGFLSPKVSEELRKMALRKLFQGSTFHHRDGLDDYDDDFTQFAKLGDIVTSDMKHMAGVEAKRKLEAALKESGSQSDGALEMMTPRQAALANLEAFNADPTGQIEYQSQGSVLIIGGTAAIETAADIKATLPPTVILTEASDLAQGKSFVITQGVRTLTLSGWLGSFEAVLTDSTGSADKIEILKADIVLDLSDTPLLTQAVKPPGYFHPEAAKLSDTLADIRGLEGTFAKPRYFDYNPSICAHSSSKLPGCTRCIDACPTEAIISIGDKIEVNPHLCQGGGTCATVCPTGAIRYNYPAPGHQINQLRRMLKSWREVGGEDVTLLLHASENRVNTNDLPQHILPMELEELASAGAELWAAALTFGAKQILLLDADDTPAVSRQHLRHQMSVLSTQLAGLGYPDDVVRLIPPLPKDETQWPAILEHNENTPLMPYFPPATQSGMNDKRQQWMLAIDHLYKHAQQPEERIPLPADAPFGSLKVDKDACTLCMACTTICPAQALSGGTDSPLLKIFPANCVQCGMCATGCPEQAIKLEPVFIANRELRQRPQILHEEAAFDCISCGKPFASQAIIKTMLDKLQGHYMFQNERAQQRLKMCEDCRVVDVVQDEEAMGQPALGTVIGAPNRQ